MFHKIESNDIALLISLGYTCVDVLVEWESFTQCRKPIHKWLLVSCLCAIGFRFARLLGSWLVATTAATGGMGRPIGGQIGECLLDISHKGGWPRVVESFTWMVFVPFFAAWNLLGTAWLWEVVQDSPSCTPTPTHIWFSCGWLFLCHCWLLVHAALVLKSWRLKSRVQRAEANLREVADGEALQRWGDLGRSSGSVVEEVAGLRGLSSAAIKALPSTLAPAAGHLNVNPHECAICLMDIQEGEGMRSLPGCGHSFHRSCIDLWLVRQAECPLCKQSVAEAL